MSSKRKSFCVADKISDLITSVPKSFGSDDEAEETKAKVVDYDDEIDNDDYDSGYGKFSIRKRHLNLLEDIDNRYQGKKVLEKDIFNKGFSFNEAAEGFDNDDNSVNDGSPGESNDDDSNALSGEEGVATDAEVSDNYSDGENGSGSEESNADSDDGKFHGEDEFGDSIDLSNPLRRFRQSENTIETVSATNIRKEIEKGCCVREQLKLWENLLEMRIKLQRCLMTSNKMPQFDSYKKYNCNDQFKVNCLHAKKEIGKLLGNLLDLQSNLLKGYPETKSIASRGQKRKARTTRNGDSESGQDDVDEEITSDTEDETIGEELTEKEEESDDQQLDKKGGKFKQAMRSKKRKKLLEFEKEICNNHEAFARYRNSVIQKWNDKTRIASGVMQKGLNQPVIKQIEFSLVNKDKLLKKTQLKRSEYEVIGKTSVSLEENEARRTQEYDTEIYDDDDFYHQLLRELIEYKSADTTDPIALSRQWVQLQNMRSKMKRKIDTRATKGRRIRYNVHQKLVNFMAPITVNDTWTDRAKDELYSSLFGKIKPVSLQAL